MDTVHFRLLQCGDSDYKIAIATLDNAPSLNALTVNMLDLLMQQLQKWQEDDEVICVLLDGAGEKAFCAGGDVRTMHDVMRDKTVQETQEFCSQFFTIEYQCDYLIHTYCKPIIAWGHGIVMGGGMGLFMGSSHKVVTPSSRLAMPEISIGLYPDVGGTWFLNRLDEGIGLFLGLTGTVMNASDAVEINLADFMVLPASKEILLQELQKTDWESVEDVYDAVTQVLETFDQQTGSHKPTSQLMPFYDQIQQACQADSLLQVVDGITAIQGNEPWLVKAKQTLMAGSPISVHLCYYQLTECQELSLADCFRLELTLSVCCCLVGEFQEGVRARLIDKDDEPNWKYKTIDAVDGKLIGEMFTSLWNEESHPLARLGHH